MGNDGGTIAKRKDIITLGFKKNLVDINRQKEIKQAHQEDSLKLCALSSLPLYDKEERPVVGDYKGNLYLKEKVLEFMVQKKLGNSENDKGDENRLGHLKAIKDIVDVKIKWKKSETTGTPYMVCLVSGESTNASSYAYLRTCGCLMSFQILQKLQGKAKVDEARSKDSKTKNVTEKEILQDSLCPSCDMPYTSVDIVRLNLENSEEVNLYNERNMMKLKSMGLSHSKAPRQHKKLKKRSKVDLEQSKRQKVNGKA